VRLAGLSASGCNRPWKDLCCNTRKEDLARCVDLLSSAKWDLDARCLLEAWTQDNKEEKSWWTYPRGGGEPHTCCVSFLCAMY
jgi:hypothetical protein